MCRGCRRCWYGRGRRELEVDKSWVSPKKQLVTRHLRNDASIPRRQIFEKNVLNFFAALAALTQSMDGDAVYFCVQLLRLAPVATDVVRLQPFRQRVDRGAIARGLRLSLPARLELRLVYFQEPPRHPFQQPQRPWAPLIKLLGEREVVGLAKVHASSEVPHHAPMDGVGPPLQRAIEFLATEGPPPAGVAGAVGVDPLDCLVELRRRQLVERFDTKCAAEPCDITAGLPDVLLQLGDLLPAQGAPDPRPRTPHHFRAARRRQAWPTAVIVDDGPAGHGRLPRRIGVGSGASLPAFTSSAPISGKECPADTSCEA